jgi:hypothetical protein
MIAMSSASAASSPSAATAFAVLEPSDVERLTRHVALSEIPASEDLMSAAALKTALEVSAAEPLDVLVGGDVMLAGRMRALLAEHGAGYPFAAVRPLLARTSTVIANLEGPLAFARKRESERRFAYRVAPQSARALAEAGIGVVTLANNHLVDCGRRGVRETLDALAAANVTAVGAGRDRASAHAPAIVRTAHGTVGILGYYWNRRCAATLTDAGSAMDDEASLAADLAALRPKVDLLLVTIHWGVPYEREPSADDRAKARRAVDLGADLIVAHHPHVVQPFEVYRNRPIFYSVGNFTFGSGNTRAEGLLVGARFAAGGLEIEVFPLYVKNRDPRVAYQPKLMTGPSAARVLDGLRAGAGESARHLTIQSPGGLTRGVLRVPWTRSA